MTGNHSHEKMGYFEGFKFGVPVAVCYCHRAISESGIGFVRAWKNELLYLVHEDASEFTVLILYMGRQKSTHLYKALTLSKLDHSYIPIPYKVDIMQPRFLVCTNRDSVAYCNVSSSMTMLDVVPSDVYVTEVKDLGCDKCSAKM